MALKVGELFAELKLDSKGFEKQLGAGEKKLGKLQDELKKTHDTIRKLSSQEIIADKQAKKLERLTKLGEQYAQTQEKINKLTSKDTLTEKEQASLSKLQEKLAKTKATIEKVESKELLTQRQQENLRKATQRASELGKEISELTQDMQTLGNAQSIYKAIKPMKEYGEAVKKAAEWQDKLGSAMITRVSLPVIGGLGYSAKTSISLEDAFAGVRKTVDATPAELDEMYDSFLELAEVIPVTAEELMEYGAAAGQLGIAKDTIVDFTDTIAALSVSTNLEDGATQLAQFANIMQTDQSGENFERLASAIVDLGNKSATTEADIMNMAYNLAAAGKNANMSEADVLGISAALASLGINAEAGGSSFSTLISNMQLAVETGSESLDDFAGVAQMTAEEFQQAFREDAAGALAAFVAGLSNGSDSAIKILDDIGITEIRMRRALLGASNATELFSQSIKTASTAWEENTALATEAGRYYETTGNRLKTLGNRARNVANQFGNTLLPKLEEGMEFAGGLVDKFASLDEATRSNIINWGLFAASIGPALKVMSKLNSVVGNLAVGLAGMAKNIVAGGGLLKTLGSGLLSALGPGGLALGAVALTGFGVFKLVNREKSLEQLQKEVSDALANYPVSDEILAQVTADFEFTDPTGQKINSLQELIANKLTDGEADTPEVLKELEDSTRETFQQMRKDIEAWYSEEMSGINLDSAEGQEQINALTALKDQYMSDVTATETATVSWINTMGGKSTQAVQQHIGELDELMGRVTEINSEITKAAELAQSSIGNAFTVVTSGMSVDSDTISQALNYAFRSWKFDTEDIEAYAAEQMEAAQKAFADAQRTGGSEWTNFLSEGGWDVSLSYSDWEKLFTGDQNEQIQAAQKAYLENINAIFRGLGMALGEDGTALQENAQKYMAGLNLSEMIGQMFENNDTSLADMTPEQKAALREQAAALLEQYAIAVGEEFANSEQLLSNLDINNDAEFFESLFDMQSGAESAAQNAMKSISEALESGDVAPIADAMSQVINSSMLEGVEGIDVSSIEGQYSLIAGQIGKNTGEFKTAGSNFAEGVATGIRSGRSSVVSASRYVAAQAASAFRNTLQIRSPSRVMEKLAEYVPMGVAKGIMAKASTVTKAMSNITDRIRNKAVVKNPGLSVRGGNTTQSTATLAIDYDQMAEAMRQQRMVLDLDGKTVAQIQATNNTRAANARNRALALGYGK